MKTIAIIEDDIYIGDMLAEVLKQEGYATLRAYSGTEALYLLSQKRPDLVLLDLMLPGLSGEEVLPHIEFVADYHWNIASYHLCVGCKGLFPAQLMVIWTCWSGKKRTRL